MKTDRLEPLAETSTNAPETDSPVDLDLARHREVARLDIGTQITRLRQHAGLSQAALADRIGTKQASIARMERRDYRGYTVGTLAKIAAATGARLEVRLAPVLRPARRLISGSGHPRLARVRSGGTDRRGMQKAPSIRLRN
jgi:transcriptional regulator with XRE-family HTH domain